MDKQIQMYELKKFIDYLNMIGSETTTEEELEDLYDEHIEIEFNHHSIQLPFDAVSYNALLDLLTTILMEG